MDPKITKISEEKGKLYFTVTGIKVPYVNALRRTILSDIDINICNTITYEENQCTITKNTSRFHNEIIKQRLSCIPIHQKELSTLPGNYVLEIDVENDTDDTIFVTTEDFRIKSKTSGNYLTKNEVLKIYPSSKETGQFIDFLRLRPKISDSIKGEHIKLNSEYSIGNANLDSMFNVASICSYGNTVDMIKANEEWEKHELSLKSQEELSEKEIEFEKKNFYALDAQRYFTENSFDFVIETVGIYDNKELVLKGCEAMNNRLKKLIEKIDNDEIKVTIPQLATSNAYQMSFVNEDYTIGKVIEDNLYEKHYIDDKTMSFVAFKKLHPHDEASILKMAFIMDVDNNYIRQVVRTALVESMEVFDKLYKLFK
jgi:DNA-directed RNA polymerase subunit L/DNA-directed RNA polymerase alpha subunit